MPLSDATMLDLLKHAFKIASMTVPSNIYIALSTADPGEDGSGVVEPDTGDGYARKLCNNWQVDTPPPAAQISNVDVLVFGPASADWGTITHWAAYTASTGGTFLAGGALGTPRDLDTGLSGTVAAGVMKIKKKPAA